MSKERKHAAKTEDSPTTACCCFLWDFFGLSINHGLIFGTLMRAQDHLRHEKESKMIPANNK